MATKVPFNLAWLFTVIAWAESSPLDPELLKEDLRVLAGTTRNYQITQVSIEEAIRQVWLQTTGHAPQVMLISVQPNVSNQPLTLNLRDVPTQKLLDILAELASSRWNIRGHHGATMILEVHPILEIDDRSLFMVAQTFSLTTQAVEIFGLRSGDDKVDLKPILTHYGVEFGTATQGGFASYSSQDHSLVTSTPDAQTSLLKSVIMLANRGLLRPRSESPPQVRR